MIINKISNKGLSIHKMWKSHVIIWFLYDFWKFLYNSHPIWYASWLSNFEFILVHITKLLLFLNFIFRLPDSIGVFLSGTRAPSRVMAPQVKTRVPTEFYQSQHRGRHCSDVELRESQDGRRGWKTKSVSFQRWWKCNTG